MRVRERREAGGEGDPAVGAKDNAVAGIAGDTAPRTRRETGGEDDSAASAENSSMAGDEGIPIL